MKNMDARLEKNLEVLSEVIPTTNSIIKATKEKEKEEKNSEDKAMFSAGTIKRYAQQTKQRNYDEEMEIG
ncbi:MAG: hypothetical protein HFJ48_00490 [Clostridia bacterium]|nr:hypothetical protein [Clostridia bacterium]